MHPMLTIAKRATYAAASLITQSFDRSDKLKIKTKSANDFVSNIDIAVENSITDTILASFPEHLVIGEENGAVGNAGSEYRWVIDPIDGTTNFIKGLPHFAISIAVFKNDKPEIGVVYNPIHDEMFAAARGQGATLNDRKIRTSQVLPETAIIATGLPLANPDIMPKASRVLNRVLTTFPDIRRTGSAALDLCYVASGRVDAYYEFNLSEWDMAAGVLIAQESGALVSDTEGQFNHFKTGDVVAAPSKVYKTLIKLTKQAII